MTMPDSNTAALNAWEIEMERASRRYEIQESLENEFKDDIDWGAVKRQLAEDDMLEDLLDLLYQNSPQAREILIRAVNETARQWAKERL